ncbi:hypothetical protein ACGFY7_23080 [Streptomyces prunicolor]|uniref:hypothetical protein n=1 Tax=Streptomyces prunicolor TaxID=67348 RepID=UPI003710AAC7
MHAWRRGKTALLEAGSPLGGAVPEPSLFRGLAPALRLRAADLFVIVGMSVPDDLAALDARSGSMAASLVPDAMRLSREDRRLLRRLVRSLPQEHRTQPVETLRAHEQFGRGPGGVLVRMVRNRNPSWGGTARTFLSLTVEQVGQVGDTARYMLRG